MKAHVFKNRTNCQPIEVTHGHTRARKNHEAAIKAQRGHVHHDAIRVIMKNTANSEAIALMMAKAERKANV